MKNKINIATDKSKSVQPCPLLSGCCNNIFRQEEIEVAYHVWHVRAQGVVSITVESIVAILFLTDWDVIFKFEEECLCSC